MLNVCLCFCFVAPYGACYMGVLVYIYLYPDARFKTKKALVITIEVERSALFSFYL